MNAITRTPHSSAIAVLAIAAYLLTTQIMEAGPMRTMSAAAVPVIALVVTMMIILKRLQIRGSDRTQTMALFNLAGSLVLTVPILALAVHIRG